MGNYNERLKTLPDTGTYTLVVGVHGPSEPMLFSIYIQRVNNPTGSILIESGETIAASIDIPAEKDTYHFTAVAGDGIIIRMRGSSFGCHIQVFGPDGTPLSETLDGTQFQAP